MSVLQERFRELLTEILRTSLGRGEMDELVEVALLVCDGDALGGEENVVEVVVLEVVTLGGQVALPLVLDHLQQDGRVQNAAPVRHVVEQDGHQLPVL